MNTTIFSRVRAFVLCFQREFSVYNSTDLVQRSINRLPPPRQTNLPSTFCTSHSSFESVRGEGVCSFSDSQCKRSSRVPRRGGCSPPWAATCRRRCPQYCRIKLQLPPDRLFRSVVATKIYSRTVVYSYYCRFRSKMRVTFILHHFLYTSTYTTVLRGTHQCGTGVRPRGFETKCNLLYYTTNSTVVVLLFSTVKAVP